MATKKTETTKAPAATATDAKKPAAAAKAKTGATAKSESKPKSDAKPKSEPKAKAAAKPKAAASGRTDGIHKPVTPSPELAAIVGGEPLARGEIVSKMWDYIKKNKLQNPDDGREIMADATLEAVFGKKKVTMFEMNKLIAGHVS